jgi:hypothetical protein
MPALPFRCLLLTLLLVVIPGSPIAAPASSVVLEYEAKAAFLYNLLKFVQWPDTVQNQLGPFPVCVMEPDPFGAALTAAMNQKNVSGRPIELRYLKTTEYLSECQVVFVPFQDKRRIVSLLRSTQRAPILTVGETGEFLDAGGMVGLVLGAGKLRLQINIDAVHAADLKMSAQLLRLAQEGRTSR